MTVQTDNRIRELKRYIKERKDRIEEMMARNSYDRAYSATLSERFQELDNVDQQINKLYPRDELIQVANPPR